MFFLANALYFSFPGSETMLNIIMLFLEIFIIGLAIFLILIEVLSALLIYFNEDVKMMPSHFTPEMESFLDIFFLIFPTLVIIYILVPTLGFLYASDFNIDTSNFTLTLSVVGHQWYWSYEYHIKGFNRILLMDFSESKDLYQWDSIMMDSWDRRLLTVDNPVLFPVLTPVLLQVTSDDVIHSWALPQLGIKVDALPGRIATVILHTYINARWVGQCSELCGAYHAFMPIVMESVTVRAFFVWTLEDMQLSDLFGIDFENDEKNYISAEEDYYDANSNKFARKYTRIKRLISSKVWHYSEYSNFKKKLSRFLRKHDELDDTRTDYLYS